MPTFLLGISQFADAAVQWLFERIDSIALYNSFSSLEGRPVSCSLCVRLFLQPLTRPSPSRRLHNTIPYLQSCTIAFSSYVHKLDCPGTPLRLTGVPSAFFPTNDPSLRNLPLTNFSPLTFYIRLFLDSNLVRRSFTTHFLH